MPDGSGVVERGGFVPQSRFWRDAGIPDPAWQDREKPLGNIRINQLLCSLHMS
jgi:hypothetical protein